MPVYVCQSDDYVVVKKGQKIIDRGTFAENVDGDSLKIDLDYLRSHPEDFKLETTDKPADNAVDKSVVKPPEPVQVKLEKAEPTPPCGGYALVRRIGKIHKTLESAKVAAQKKGGGDVYVVQIVGKVNIVHEVKYQQL